MSDIFFKALAQFGADNADLLEFLEKLSEDELYRNIAHILDNSYPDWRYAKGIGHSAIDFFDIIYGKFECEGLDEESEARKMAALTKIVIDAYNPYKAEARCELEERLALAFEPNTDEDLPLEEYKKLYNIEWEEYLKKELEELVIPKL